ncbi:ATP-binding cassette domain-containing protein [Fervidicoccus fontis]|uniref:ATP-binding cassette domain-containing protein n=1 Tax=Fervidicoccus fontis TaxID=683846 RepID=UPI0013053DDC|nr:ATP-binding cassette domain-containing protein [Fervidicoccus fontis]
MINVESLVVSYGRLKEPVLKSVNAVFDGKSLVLGPNGSGKTTLFRALCGLTNVKGGGRILVDGVDVENIYAKTGVIAANFPEVLSLLSIRVVDLIDLHADLTGGDRSVALRILGDLGISEAFLRGKKLH